MNETKILFNVYEVVPRLASEFIGQHGLLAVIIGGSYARRQFRKSSDIDADLLFQQINSGIATTITHAMSNFFKEVGLTLDIRMCVDLAGNAIFLHHNTGIMRPTEGTVNLNNLYNDNHIVIPPSFKALLLKEI